MRGATLARADAIVKARGNGLRLGRAKDPRYTEHHPDGLAFRRRRGKRVMHTFVAEVDGKPVIAFQAKNKAAARAFVERKSIKTEIRSMTHRGKRIWDRASELTVRAAKPAERRHFAMSMLSLGLLAKRVDVNFWVSLLSASI